ncbi:MAG: hypothetical protein RL497_1802 [Pseudomonadota bacterium]
MNKQHYLIVGWVLAFISLVAIGVFPFLPERHWDLTAEGQLGRYLITDKNKGGGTQAVWLNEAQGHYVCTIQADTKDPFCAMQINLAPQPGQGRDLSGFNRLRTKVRYQGPGRVLRLHMRVFDPRFSKLEQPDSAKFQHYVFAPSAENTHIEIPLAGFSVADWWVREYAPQRAFAQQDFANVLLFGIDIPAPTLPGAYDIQLEALEFVGPWIRFEQLLIGLILLWSCLAAAFLVAGWWRLYRQWRLEYPAWRELQQSLAGYKPAAFFRPYNTFRDKSTQCLDHTGLVLALVELLQQSIRPRLPFVVLELVTPTSNLNQQALAEDVQVQFAERLKRYTKDDIAVVIRWRGPCFIVLGMANQEQLMARLALLRATLHINPLMQLEQPADLILACGVLENLEHAFGQLLDCWWRMQRRKRSACFHASPKAFAANSL